MGQLLLYIVLALVLATIVFGVTVMMGGGDSGLTPVEPDGRSAPLPTDRPLAEEDISRTRFDTAWRGYRMAQVDEALQRAAYDIGYKSELIGVLEAEVTALREGRTADADALRGAREAAVAPVAPPPAPLPGAAAPVVTAPAPDGVTPPRAAAAPAPAAAAPDAPKAEAPKPDAPKADAPKADAPKTDAPQADAPAEAQRREPAVPGGEAVESAPVEPR